MIMKIKVCGLKEQDNINDIIQLEPHFIGLIFHPSSKRYIGHDSGLQRYLRSVTNVQKIGVFVNETYNTILEHIDTYGLNMVQLHGNESPEYCACLSGHIPIIKAFGIDADFDFDQLNYYRDSCAYFLFDTATQDYGGSGKSFDWQLIQRYHLSKPFILSGGISLKNIQEVRQLKHKNLMCIDVNSRFETAPGIKDIQQIKTLIDEFRN